MYRAWARAVVDDAFDGPFERKYAVGVRLPARRGPRPGAARASASSEANAQVGPPRRGVQAAERGRAESDSYEGDGYVIVRDPDTEVVKAAMKTDHRDHPGRVRLR